YSLYQPVAGDIASGEKIRTELSNGVLTVDGQRVLDEDGNINSVYAIDGKVYYFISKKSPSRESSIMFVLKRLDGQKIREFEGQAIWVTPSREDLPLILVKLSGSGNVYDNVYSFDGDKVSLVNKNVPVSGNSVISSNFVFTPKYRRSDNKTTTSLIKIDLPIKQPKGYGGGLVFKGTDIVDLKTGKAVSVQMKRAPYLTLFGSKSSWLTVVGAAGDNIIFLYKDVNGDYVIEAQNVYTEENFTLVEGGTSVQFLKGGGRVVLRVFRGSERESSSFIDLARLKEVSINLADYQGIVLRGGYDNLGGGYTTMDYTTYTPYQIKKVIHKSKRKINDRLVKGRVLF
ncbi:MAG: hypothetical protein ABFS56_29860, partial [Pseudomonadota bacterium]